MKEYNVTGMSCAACSARVEKAILGVSGVSNDNRDVAAAAAEGNHRAQLAIDMQRYQIAKFVGSYIAAMDGVDVIAFTGGIGENAWFMRGPILQDMEYLGVKIDMEANDATMGEARIISTPDSKVTVVVFPTDEEYMIAKDTYDIVKSL